MAATKFTATKVPAPINRALQPPSAVPDPTPTPLAAAMLRLRSAADGVGGLTATMAQQLQSLMAPTPEGVSTGEPPVGGSVVVQTINEIAASIESHVNAGFATLRALEL